MEDTGRDPFFQFYICESHYNYYSKSFYSGFIFSTFGHLALMEDATNGARSTNHSYLRTSRSTWGRRCPWIIFPIKNNTGTKRVMFRLLREAIKVKTENKLLFIFFLLWWLPSGKSEERLSLLGLSQVWRGPGNWEDRPVTIFCLKSRLGTE